MYYAGEDVLDQRLSVDGRRERAAHRRVAGERVGVFGCGGLGLSAVIVAAQAGAHVTAVDRSPDALEFARRLGAADADTTMPSELHRAVHVSFQRIRYLCSNWILT